MITVVLAVIARLLTGKSTQEAVEFAVAAFSLKRTIRRQHHRRFGEHPLPHGYE